MLPDMENPEDFIERRIIEALIISEEFIRKVLPFLDHRVLESEAARTLAKWCIDYWNQYGKPPRENIQSIFFTNLSKLRKDMVEWIEVVINSIYGTIASFEIADLDYLIDQSIRYLRKRRLIYQIGKAAEYLEHDDIERAEASLWEGIDLKTESEFGTPLDPFSRQVKPKIQLAFAERQEPLIQTPKALGRFWDREFCRGAFVAIMGREKIGKTFMLIELAMRAIQSGSKVLFFQAGDMTEEQQLRRIAIWINKRSDDKRYCSGMWIPEPDCWWNLVDDCDESVREDSGDQIFPSTVDREKVLTMDEIVKQVMKFPHHKPCRNCDKMKGFPWLKWRPEVSPLTEEEAYRSLIRFGRSTKGSFRLLTYPNETLTTREIRSKILFLKRNEGFTPDVVIIDYADILAPDPDSYRMEYRHQQNRIWQRLRSLSQEFNCLVLTATQIKAGGYKKDLLTMSEFSEDKRKFAHVTAMYGLNQSVEEKRIGIIRINEIVVREADYDPLRPVWVLGRLQMGRPVLHSFRNF